MREIALWTAYLKSKIRQKYCYYITDGTAIYLVTPLWVRLLIPRGKRGRLIVLELQRVIRWITDYLIRISLVYLSVYELASSTRYTEWIIKKRPSLHRVKRAIIGIYVFLIQIATYQGRIARDLRKRTYQAAYAAIYNFDNRPEVHDSGKIEIGARCPDFSFAKTKRSSVSFRRDGRTDSFRSNERQLSNEGRTVQYRMLALDTVHSTDGRRPSHLLYHTHQNHHIHRLQLLHTVGLTRSTPKDICTSPPRRRRRRSRVSRHTNIQEVFK